MSYVFLSYTKSDRDSAFAIRDLLEESGFSVWLDKNQSELNAWHWHKIQANIQVAGAVVVLVSDAAKGSAWLKRELDFAESLQKPLFPLLIQGSGWSRFGGKLEKLSFGLKLALPISLLENLQTALETAPTSALPEQIMLNPYPQATSKRQMAIIAGGLLLGSLLFLALISPLIIREFTASPLQLTHIAREESNMESTQNRRALTQTQSANRQATNTQRALIQQNRSITIAQTQAAYLESIPTQNAPYQANLSLTAVAGNGVLPCAALVRYNTENSHLLYYRQANLEALTWQVNIQYSGLNLIVSEWIVNEQGVWYRVGTENRANIGYLRAEDIVLEADCPR